MELWHSVFEISPHTLPKAIALLLILTWSSLSSGNCGGYAGYDLVHSVSNLPLITLGVRISDKLTIKYPSLRDRNICWCAD